MKQFTFLLFLFGIFIHLKVDAQRTKPRVIISTDIGGDDPDDFQSMVHLLMYANELNIEGLVSSPPGEGRKEHIIEALDAYAQDFEKLRKHGNFPSPEYLNSVTKQGLTEVQSTPKPSSEVSEGANWIIEKARQKNDQPLYLLVWGSMTDVAQALHFAPDIKENIRVYMIGSWNTRMDSLARNYVFEHHPDLWLIENNTTFRGMYMGGDQSDDFGNTSFVEKYVKDHGALGEIFYQKKKDIKMGDTPSVLYLLNGDPDQPETGSWGGRFLRTDHGPNYFTDLADPKFIENNRPGAKTVNVWRKDFLTDWATRMKWLE
ncbi:DUF1593 domain-containing protein [Jiulongibacter sediminis]|uniref:DUF1593 domain-containing protein n=1 Tax=Jiulongibacter sediminis TaxID=1605367 RepID=UPI0009EB04B8|nr:DUF1593 domain-containing protein [Jiulongibacter sediminis]